MKTRSRSFLPRSLLVSLAVLAAVGGTAQAQDSYPSRTVTIIVPFTAGSQPDILARALAEQMAKAMGQAVVVTNRDGAAGVIGVDAVARSKPDGYTLGFGPQGQFTIQPAVRKDLKYKITDFQFICQTNSSQLVVATSAKSPYNTLTELLDAARKSPGKITFASPGQSTGPHLAAESIALEAGVKLLHVPFRSVGEMQTQILSGAVDFFVTSPAFVTTRKDTRGLAAVANQRIAGLPNLSTLKEQGFKRSTLEGFIGLFAPHDIPEAATAALRKACPGAVASEPFKQAAEKMLTPAHYADAPAYTATIMQDQKTMGDLVKALGIRPE